MERAAGERSSPRPMQAPDAAADGAQSQAHTLHALEKGASVRRAILSWYVHTTDAVLRAL